MPWITSYARLHAAYIHNIARIFPKDQLVTQELIRVPAGLLVQLNAELRVAEQVSAEEEPINAEELQTAAADAVSQQARSFHRPARRHGVYLDESEVHGMLVTDMTDNALKPDGNELMTTNLNITIEFKPKWLAQSPSAPRDSRRCRTCALRASRLSRGGPDTARKTPYFCPLGLVSKDRNIVVNIAQSLLVGRIESFQVEKQRELIDYVTNFLLGSDLLRRLTQAQQSLDPHGILRRRFRNGVDSEFLTAMTLRDCTLFLRIRSARDSSAEDFLVEARLGDLDLKEPEPTKVAYWRETERMLTDQGWYRGDAPVPDEYAMKCLLDKQ